MNNLLVDECLSELEKKIEALASLIDQQTQRAPKRGQGNSSYNYKEQVQQLYDNEGIYALLEKDIRECNLVFQNLKEESKHLHRLRRNRMNVLMRKSSQLKRGKLKSTIYES